MDQMKDYIQRLQVAEYQRHSKEAEDYSCQNNGEKKRKKMNKTRGKMKNIYTRSIIDFTKSVYFHFIVLVSVQNKVKLDKMFQSGWPNYENYLDDWDYCFCCCQNIVYLKKLIEQFS